MATGQLAPYASLQFFTDAGLVASGYQLFTYEAGTTTKIATYSDSALTIANSNPIILDAAGRCVVFMPDAAIKMVLATDIDTDPPASPVWTVDGIRGVPLSTANIDVTGICGETIGTGDVVFLSDGAGGLTAGRWYLADSDHNYASVDAPSIGFVITGGNAGDDCTVRVSGVATYAGTLAAGTVYYVSSTAGDLSASSTQTNREPLGQALTTTTILFPIGGTVSISIKAGLATFAYSSGQGNGAGGGDTELTNYPVVVPDNFLDTPGACIVVEGTLILAANGNAKTMKVQIGATAVLTVFSNSDNIANHRVPFRFNIIRRSATAAALTGIFFYGAGNQAEAKCWLVNHIMGGTVDWTIKQTLKLYLVGTLANDILLSDLFVSQNRSPYGVTV
jgi:hypothetical protein